jgi:hypothetical protein
MLLLGRFELTTTTIDILSIYQHFFTNYLNTCGDVLKHLFIRSIINTSSRIELHMRDAMAIPGPPGIIGPAGPIGVTGPPGHQGFIDPTGLQGVQGLIGPVGISGPTGAIGEIGIKGDKGDKGDRGDTGVIGEKGEEGPRGGQGFQGIQGFLLSVSQRMGSILWIHLDGRLLVCK